MQPLLKGPVKREPSKDPPAASATPMSSDMTTLQRKRPAVSQPLQPDATTALPPPSSPPSTAPPPHSSPPHKKANLAKYRIPDSLVLAPKPKSSSSSATVLRPKPVSSSQPPKPPKSPASKQPSVAQLPRPPSPDSPLPMAPAAAPLSMPPPLLPSRGEVTTGSVLTVDSVKYRILCPIGKGGTSVVYHALDPHDTPVAVKAVSGVQNISGFKKELELLAQLRATCGAHVVQLLGHEISPDTTRGIAVLELGQGDLAQFLEARRREPDGLTRQQARSLWESMLMIMGAVHEARVVHGDLKPANFIFCKGKLKLIDFGIANEINDDTIHIRRDHQMGTLNYIPPEALRATTANIFKLSTKADIWSLGCILHLMVYGRTPYQHILNTDMQLKANMISSDAPVELPALTPPDAALSDVLAKCLCKIPERRPDIRELKKHVYLAGSAAPAATQATPRAVAELVFTMALKARAVAELTQSDPALCKQFAIDVVRNLQSTDDVAAAIETALPRPRTADPDKENREIRKPKLSERVGG